MHLSGRLKQPLPHKVSIFGHMLIVTETSSFYGKSINLVHFALADWIALRQTHVERFTQNLQIEEYTVVVSFLPNKLRLGVFYRTYILVNYDQFGNS